jgi:hypothetical protein
MKNTVITNLFENDILKISNVLPPEIIQSALSLKNKALKEERANYAGKSVDVPFHLSSEIINHLTESGIVLPKLIHARLRVATADDANDFRTFVHIDEMSSHALIIYLENTLYKNPQEAGTLFWEHTNGKTKKVNLNKNSSALRGAMMLERDTKDLARWENWLNCPFEKNTGTLFEASYFHSPPSPHSEKHKNGVRITMDFFLGDRPR